MAFQQIGRCSFRCRQRHAELASMHETEEVDCLALVAAGERLAWLLWGVVVEETFRMLKENKNGFKRKRRRLLFLFFLFCILFSFLNPHSLFLYLLRFAVTFSLFRASQSLPLSRIIFFLLSLRHSKKQKQPGPPRTLFFREAPLPSGPSAASYRRGRRGASARSETMNRDHS